MRFFVLLVLLIISSCKRNRLDVQKPETFTEAKFNNYYNLLQAAIATSDKFGIGTQLANLEAPSQDVFYYINQGIKDNPKNCDNIIIWERIRKGGFYNVVVSSDTLEFFKSVQLCKSLVGNEKYNSILNLSENSNTKEIVKTSTSVRPGLVDTLEIILDRDQNIRALFSGPDRKEHEKDKDLLREMKTSDSLNLITALKIIEDYKGYPNSKFTGKKHQITLWLVFQHVVDLEKRIEYRKIIEDGVRRGILGDGNLIAYDKRTEELSWESR